MGRMTDEDAHDDETTDDVDLVASCVEAIVELELRIERLEAQVAARDESLRGLLESMRLGQESQQRASEAREELIQTLLTGREGESGLFDQLAEMREIAKKETREIREAKALFEEAVRLRDAGLEGDDLHDALRQFLAERDPGE